MPKGRRCYFVSSHGSGRLTANTYDRKKAVRELREIIADAAASCRRSYRRCSIVRQSSTAVEIKIGGRDRHAPRWNHYALVSCDLPGSRY